MIKVLCHFLSLKWWRFCNILLASVTILSSAFTFFCVRACVFVYSILKPFAYIPFRLPFFAIHHHLNHWNYFRLSSRNKTKNSSINRESKKILLQKTWTFFFIGFREICSRRNELRGPHRQMCTYTLFEIHAKYRIILFTFPISVNLLTWINCIKREICHHISFLCRFFVFCLGPNNIFHVAVRNKCDQNVYAHQQQ